MPVTAKCVCVYEETKSKVASSVREFAGFASSEELNVIKRNKDLKSGDFIVFAPSHRIQADTDSVCRSRHVCHDESSEAANINLSAEANSGSGEFLVSYSFCNPSYYRYLSPLSFYLFFNVFFYCLPVEESMSWN